MVSTQTFTVRPQYLRMGEGVARRVPGILSQRGLEPRFSAWLLTEYHGRYWLFGVLDAARLVRMEQYISAATLHHLSTALEGLPTFVSNTNGLRYAFLLSRPPRLPRQAVFPSSKRGLVRLGMGPHGKEVAVAWAGLGHLLVAGMTGYGKSTFLRLLAHQAIGEGAQLLLADLDGTTFPMLAGHPALLAPIAHTPEEAQGVVERALGECDHRAALYSQVAGFPEGLEEYGEAAVEAGLDPLPPLVVVLDEFNATVEALGGARKGFAGQAAQLAWRGRKFGIHLVFAAQDFAKAVVGRVRDQVGLVVCFRVRSPQTAQAVGCSGAHRLTVPGRAITDRWGPLQAYYLDKELLVGERLRPPLSEEEQTLVYWSLGLHEGRMSIPLLTEYGLREREARGLVEEWERRGWLRKDPHRYNARYLTEALVRLLGDPGASNRRTGQAPSNPGSGRRTGRRAASNPGSGRQTAEEEV
jgi:hypothetical protein